jgi:hypothetical protein
MTNKGLRLETFLGGGNILDLACTGLDCSGGEKRVGVFLTKTADGYVRSSPTKLFETTDPRLWAGARYKIFIRKRVTPFVSDELREALAKNLSIYFDICPGFEVRSFAAKPADLWDHHHHAFISNDNKKFTGFLDFQISNTARSFLSERIIVVCSLYLRHTQDTKDSAGIWRAIYDSWDGSTSSAIMKCIDGYYHSYGEEYYLSQLQDAVTTREWYSQQEVNVPAGDKGRHLCISSDAHVDAETGAHRLVIKVASR